MQRSEGERTTGLREQARKFRELAIADKAGTIRVQLLAIASQCEQLAASIEGANRRSVAKSRLRVVTARD